MTRVEEYRQALTALDDWDAFLLEHSNLPGPRGNLELAQATADLGTFEQFEHFLSFDASQAPTNTPGEFLAFCGVVGMGRLVAEGRFDLLPRLRACASDPRWRMHEGAAMALQRLGDVDMPRLLAEMDGWVDGSWLEKRAAAAALAEPRLLHHPEYVRRTLQIFDRITQAVAGADAPVRRSDDFKTLRQGMGYCWSVAAAALPEKGVVYLKKWLAHPDPDVQWIMKENLKKKRIAGLLGLLGAGPSP